MLDHYNKALHYTLWTYVTQHIEMDQLGQKFKIDFLLFSKFKWLFFQLIVLVQICLKSGIAFLFIVITLMMSKQVSEKLILREREKKEVLKVWESVQKIGMQVIHKSISTWKHSFYIKSFKYLREQVLNIPKYLISQK